MNRLFVLNSLFEVMNSKREVSVEKFSYVFPGIEDDEYNEILEIMAENNIKLTEEFDEEISLQGSVMGSSKELAKLTNEELCELIKKGNAVAGRALILKNSRLVYKYAMAFKKQFFNCSLEIEDLKNTGYSALMNAAKKYDTSMNCRFSTYCCYYVKGNIIREIFNNGYTIRIPAHMFESVCRAARCRSKYPFFTTSELIEIFARTEKNMTIEKARVVFKQLELLRLVSLDQPVNESEDTYLGEMIADDAIDVETEVENRILKVEVWEEVAELLTEREQFVLARRFGRDGREYTLEELGEELGITRERIRQIQEKALRKLRRSKFLKSIAA